MRIFGFAVIAAGVSGLVSAPMPAVARDDVARTSYQAIAKGQFGAAERKLTAEARIFPDRADVLLNLAAVYASTGRPVMAAKVYDRVLAQDDVLMDLSGNRTLSAHRIARIGLQRLIPMQTASR